MDHSDIRGLATAFHHFFAGLPRSSSGDHPENCVCSVRGSHKSVEGSPDRSRASRFRFGMWLCVSLVGDESPVAGRGSDSVLQCDVLADVPDEACELAGNGDADFVLIELASHGEAAPTFGQTQLGLPGDIANDLRLALLAHFERAGDLSFETIGPGRLDEDASSMLVAALGDGTLTTVVAAGELRWPQCLAQLRGRGVDRSDKSRCRATRVSNRDRDRVLMNIQSDVGSDSLFHGLSPASLGTSNPSGSVHVARRIHLRNPRYRETDLSSHLDQVSLIPNRGSGHDVYPIVLTLPLLMDGSDLENSCS
jgi:hypothetical protein